LSVHGAQRGEISARAHLLAARLHDQVV
jgi:hypothetical protein